MNNLSENIISISSFNEEEISVSKKQREGKQTVTENQNFEIYKVPSDGHCNMHCFAKQFKETISHIFQRLWNEIDSKTDVYLLFRVYESPDALQNELTWYTSDKHMIMTPQIL